MGIMVGTLNSDVTRIELWNRDGSYAGTMTVSNSKQSTTSNTRSVSMASKKKYKKLTYNYKRLSNQIMQAKTSINAKQITTKTKFQIADLRMKLISGDYNYTDIHNALVHAEKIARVAQKRLKHLQEEENIEKTGRKGMTDPEEMKEQEEENEDIIDTTAMSQDELKELAQELQEEMKKIEDELAEAMKSEDLMEEFVQGSSQQMDPHDLEMLKKKHRADELRDIMKADMEYLKALFDKLAKEKQASASGASNSSNDSSDASSGNVSGISLELGGVDIPVETAEAPLEIAGTNLDMTV